MSEIPNHGNRPVAFVGAKMSGRTKENKWRGLVLKALIQTGEEEDRVASGAVIVAYVGTARHLCA